MAFVSEILLFCRCLRGVNRPDRRGKPTSGAEKAFTVLHIFAQLFSACQKIGIYMNPKNKWRFKIAKNFDVR